MNDQYLKGEASSRRVWLMGEELFPAHSQSVFNHSPDGFSWGYNGSGPSQLALAVMLEMLPSGKACKIYKDFREAFIANVPMDKDFEIEISKIEEWLERKKS